MPCLNAPAASTVTQGTPVCWGTDEMPTLFAGVLEPEFSPTEEYEQTIKLKDIDGITQSYIFNNHMKSGDYTLIAQTGTPIPAAGELVTDTTDSRKYIVTSRKPAFTSGDVLRVTISIEQGEGALFDA